MYISKLLLLPLLVTFCVSATDTLPKKLIFAVQPHDARLFEQNKLNQNKVVQLAKALDLPLEIYECPWARCMQAIKSGKADIIDDLFYSEERSRYLSFLQPNIRTQSAGFRFYADNNQTPKVASWEDLKGLRIGMLRGYVHFTKFEEASDLNKLDFLSIEVIARLILKQRLDILIAPPSFDEASFIKVDPSMKLTKQPYSHIENIPLYLGLSNKSAWFAHQNYLEEVLLTLLLDSAS